MIPNVVKSNGFVLQCMDISRVSTSYVENLIKIIKKDFMSGRIDRDSYETQINMITGLKLQLEHLGSLSKEQLYLGAVVDAKA